MMAFRQPWQKKATLSSCATQCSLSPYRRPD
jgi:hypothetical protein